MSSTQQDFNIDKDRTSLSKEAQRTSLSYTRERFWLRLLPFCIVVVVLLLFLGVSQGIFYDRWYSPAAERVAEVVHFPLIRVDTGFVTYAEFAQQREQLTAYDNPQSTLGSIFPSYSNTDVALLTKLVKDQILKDAYSHYTISVTPEELEEEFVSIFGVASNSIDGTELVRETLGVTPQELLHGVLTEYVLKQKLTQALRAEEEVHNERFSLLSGIREEVMADAATFELYSTGNVKRQNVFTRYVGLLSPSELRGDAGELRLLEDGDISSIIEFADRFSLYRVIRNISDATGVKFIEVEELYVPKPSADTYVQTVLPTTPITVLMPSYTWDTSCQQVVEKSGGCYTPQKAVAPANWTEPE